MRAVDLLWKVACAKPGYLRRADAKIGEERSLTKLTHCPHDCQSVRFSKIMREQLCNLGSPLLQRGDHPQRTSARIFARKLSERPRPTRPINRMPGRRSRHGPKTAKPSAMDCRRPCLPPIRCRLPGRHRLGCRTGWREVPTLCPLMCRNKGPSPTRRA